MASTTAMYTGLSGLTAHARQLDVIGNNIANASTTSFKSSRMLFANAFSRTFSAGSVPSAESGGTNPGQIGMGVKIAGTQRDFRGGPIANTGDDRDLAIDGSGFFILERADRVTYSRDGAFRLNSQNDMINVSGDRVMGFGVDDNFEIDAGRLIPLNIPVGTATLAQATQRVEFSGNLNADGLLPTQGSLIDVGQLLLPGGALPVVGTSLVDLESPDTPGAFRFSEGEVLQLTGAQKGSKTLPDASMVIERGTTIQDLIGFLNSALGIDVTTINPDGEQPGARLNATNGALEIVGNTGTVNDLAIDAPDLRVLSAGGVFLRQPFAPEQVTEADGESVRTTFIAYDSLGSTVELDLSMILEGRDDNGTRWRYIVESGDDSDPGLAVGSGLISFDTFGQIIGTPTAAVAVDRSGTGAVNPLVFDLAFGSDLDSMTALSDEQSAMAATFQDGAPLGTLVSYAVGVNGIITGAFTNGLVRSVGQVAVATFANDEGLVDLGDNLYSAGPNSGNPVVSAPTEFGSGRVLGGALEQSNVDLAQEFINLIQTQTGYSASSRVITATDQLLQQLLVLGR